MDNRKTYKIEVTRDELSALSKIRIRGDTKQWIKMLVISLTMIMLGLTIK